MAKEVTYILFLILFPAVLIAQGVKGNAANVEDPKLLFISPAATALQNNPGIVAGYELYYSGLGGNGLRNGFAGLLFPHRRWGAFSLNGQYFTADIYRSGNFSLGYGKTVWNDKLSLGLELGIAFLGYNRDNFRLIDLNDPVFANGSSKSALDLGISLVARPIAPLYLAVVLKHLNRPNLSLVGDEVRMPLYFQGAALFANSFASPLVAIEYADDKVNVNFGLQRWLLDHRAMVRANYYRFNFGVTAGFIVPVQQNMVRLEYEYRYPLSDLSDVSGASHLFMLCYSISNRHPDFEFTVQAAQSSVYPGEGARFLITLQRKGGFSDPLDLSVAGLDSNIEVTLLPGRLTQQGTATLTLVPSEKVVPGDYPFRIRLRGGKKQKEQSLKLTIKKFPTLYADVQASVNRLIIKETTRIRSRDPLLPYIFFAENQAVLNADRYEILNPGRKPVTRFIFFPERLLDIPSKYRNTLNVIAKRLWDHPEMEITVKGYVSNWGEEKNNLALSRRRAETVREYLIYNCGVRPGQVKIEAHLMPPDPASNADPRGREENQRVEITCPVESQPILDPIVTETSEIATSDSICYFRLKDPVAEAGLKRWQLAIYQANGDTFRIFSGNQLPAAPIPWDWKNNEGQSVSVGKIYHYQLTLWDKFGQHYSTRPKSIRVERVSEIERAYIQKNIEKTRLILFKYDRADMNLTSRSLREELELNVQKLRANSGAKLLIQGHTDVIGDPDYNQRLSLRRAETVARYFMDRGISIARITYQGFGMSQPLMGNDLPEGRMMNRRVEIYILY